jgi:hypothetical protein
MINSVQSTNPFDQIARQLVDRFDANKDGQLTTEEFTSFLSNFLTSTATPTAAPNGNAFGVTAGAGSNGLKLGTVKPRLEGFDAGKIADASHLSEKYKFARVAQQYSIESVTSKSAAEALLNTMKADLQAAGMDVLDVKNDKIKIKVDGEEAWIDVLRGAGSGQAAAWQWLDTRF